jgi:hypothetical protein
MELPQLEGTEKQIAWAASIREKLIQSVNKKLSEKRLIDFVGCTDEIAQNISESNQNRTSAKWWIENRDMTADCLIAIALLRLKLIKPGEAFRVRDTYTEKTKQDGEWMVTREVDNNNLVVPIPFRSPLTVKAAETVYVVEQWGANLESVSATTVRPEEKDETRILTLLKAFNESRNSMGGWVARDLVLVVLKYSFSYPSEAPPYFSCYGLSRNPKS